MRSTEADSPEASLKLEVPEDSAEPDALSARVYFQDEATHELKFPSARTTSSPGDYPGNSEPYDGKDEDIYDKRERGFPKLKTEESMPEPSSRQTDSCSVEDPEGFRAFKRRSNSVDRRSSTERCKRARNTSESALKEEGDPTETAEGFSEATHRAEPTSEASHIEKSENQENLSRQASNGMSKRKRRTGWDTSQTVPPIAPPASKPMTSTTTGFTASLAGMSPEQIQMELMERNAQSISLAATMQMKPPSASQLCRIYVGSLDYSLTDQDIRQVFAAFGTICNIDMPKEGSRSKGFCFVEYSTPEAAEMAIQTMPGFNLKGRAIKVGRPTALGGQGSFMPMTGGNVTFGAAKAGGVNAAEAGQIAAAMLLAKSEGIVGLSPQDSHNRVYVGSVPYSFTAEDMKLIPSNERPGTHRGYGFIEYSTFDEAKLAIETMNDFPVAGKILKVNYATALRASGGMSPGSTPQPPSGTAALMSGQGLTAAGASNVPLPFGYEAAAYQIQQATEGALLNMHRTGTPGALAPSPVLLLYNMVDPSEANDEVKEEIHAECSKYGRVRSVDIVVDNTHGVRIFVLFESPEHAGVALPMLHDRWFGGKKITARLYDYNAFISKNFWL